MPNTPYCQRCRVYVDEEQKTCPLCHGVLTHHEHNLPFESALPPFAQERENYWQDSSRPRGLNVFRQLGAFATFALLTSVFVLGTLAFLHKTRFSVWPVAYSYALVSLLYAAAVIACARYCSRFVYFTLAFVAITTLFLLWLDSIDAVFNWSYQQGIPILLAIFFPVFIPNVIWKTTRARGLNVIAWTMFSMALSVGAVDVASSSCTYLSFSGWSVIVMGIFVALGVYFLYLHYHLKVNWQVDRVFRIIRRTDTERKK